MVLQAILDRFPRPHRGCRQGLKSIGQVWVCDPNLRPDQLTDAIADDAEVLIGWIFDRHDFLVRQGGPELRPAKTEKRPDNVALARPNSRQTFDTGAVQETDQHGLDLVVSVVCRGNERCPTVSTMGLEGVIPDMSGGGLSALRGLSSPRDRPLQDGTGDLQLPAELHRGSGPSWRISIELVIDVDRLQVETQIRLELLQAPGESSRVGPP